jgi:hypothetical protein
LGTSDDIKDGLLGNLICCYTLVLYHGDRLGRDDRYMIPFFVERRRYNDNNERDGLFVLTLTIAHLESDAWWYISM